MGEVTSPIYSTMALARQNLTGAHWAQFDALRHEWNNRFDAQYKKLMGGCAHTHYTHSAYVLARRNAERRIGWIRIHRRVDLMRIFAVLYQQQTNGEEPDVSLRYPASPRGDAGNDC